MAVEKDEAKGFYRIDGKIRGARTDNELVDAIRHRDNEAVLVKYGSTWCKSCKAVLPHFVELSRKFQGIDCVVASVDTMQEAVRDIKYSPHFRIFRKNRCVDEFHGANVQRLRDRMWLHSDAQAGGGQERLTRGDVELRFSLTLTQ